MTNVNSNNSNSGPNGHHHKKHNKNTGWIVGGSITGGLAVTGIGYGIYRHMNPPEPPSIIDSFMKSAKDVLPQAKGLVKPVLGIGALFGAYKLVQKAVTRDLDYGEDSLLGRASDWFSDRFGGGHHEMEGHPDDFQY